MSNKNDKALTCMCGKEAVGKHVTDDEYLCLECLKFRCQLSRHGVGLEARSRIELHLSQPHSTVPMRIDGKVAPIDKGIALLVHLMNTIPGIKTLSSCQGGDVHLFGENDSTQVFIAHEGYVSFAGANQRAITTALAEEIIMNISSEEDIRLEVSPAGTVLRWQPCDYASVVTLVKTVKRRMKWSTKTLSGESLKLAQEEMNNRWTAKLRRFEALEDGPEKAALAVELFGSWSNEAKAAQQAAAEKGSSRT